jgi:hypothetical protein
VKGVTIYQEFAFPSSVSNGFAQLKNVKSLLPIKKEELFNYDYGYT